MRFVRVARLLAITLWHASQATRAKNPSIFKFVIHSTDFRTCNLQQTDEPAFSLQAGGRWGNKEDNLIGGTTISLRSVQ